MAERLKTMKAVYKGKAFDKHTGEIFLFYEYRGREYMISDKGWKGSPLDALAKQHKEEQRKIDVEIEKRCKPDNLCKYEDTADYAIDIFWKTVEE